MATEMTAEPILERLVGFASVSRTPNDGIVGFIKSYLEDLGISATVLPGPEGDRSNLFATIGPTDRPGFVLSGHLDVVPKGEGWLGDPFTLRESEGRLIGRGAVDMKGFVAAALAAVPKLAAKDLPRPIHLALSYDEEVGCRGVRHLLAALPDLCPPPIGCLVGEPTNLTPVQRHKGKAALRITASGIAGHSSRPDQGKNAIESLLKVMNEVVALARATKEKGLKNSHFEPPYSTVQIGTVKGGIATNTIPDRAEAQVEARCVPGEDPLAILLPILSLAEGDPDLNVEVTGSYPGLDLSDTSTLVTMAERLTGKKAIPAVSYGTEAGLFQQAGIPAIICGPGDIGRAHKPEEFILRSELEETRSMVLRLPDDPLLIGLH